MTNFIQRDCTTEQNADIFTEHIQYTNGEAIAHSQNTWNWECSALQTSSILQAPEFFFFPET
jgi:hypothetical protein